MLAIWTNTSVISILGPPDLNHLNTLSFFSLGKLYFSHSIFKIDEIIDASLELLTLTFALVKMERSKLEITVESKTQSLVLCDKNVYKNDASMSGKIRTLGYAHDHSQDERKFELIIKQERLISLLLKCVEKSSRSKQIEIIIIRIIPNGNPD